MTTPGIMFASLAIILYLIGVVLIIKNLVKEKDNGQKIIIAISFVVYLITGVATIIICLNSYGYLRAPAINQITKQRPDRYTTPEEVVVNPIAPTQPSSDDAFKKHQEEMKQLRENGFK